MQTSSSLKYNEEKYDGEKVVPAGLRRDHRIRGQLDPQNVKLLFSVGSRQANRRTVQFLFYREIPALCRGDAAGSRPGGRRRRHSPGTCIVTPAACTRSWSFVRETAVDAFTHTHQITMEKITLNAQLDDARLVKPNA